LVKGKVLIDLLFLRMNKFFDTEKENQRKKELFNNKIEKLQKSLEIFFDQLFVSYEKSLDEFKEYLNSKNDINFSEDFTERKPSIYDANISITYNLTISKKEWRAMTFPDGKTNSMQDAVLEILVKKKLGANIEYENDAIDEDEVEVHYMTYWFEPMDFYKKSISNHKNIDESLEKLFSMANFLSK
tara:strand:- start:1106 stop:1663 length:558 start_codon:yes stop_codon:yes gene_type:complete